MDSKTFDLPISHFVRLRPATKQLTQRFGDRCEYLTESEQLHLLGVLVLYFQMQIDRDEQSDPEPSLLSAYDEHPFISTPNVQSALSFLFNEPDDCLLGLCEALVYQVHYSRVA